MPTEARAASPHEETGTTVPDSADASAGDAALIRWMLGLDATGRLEAAQGFVDSVETLRNARRD